MLGCERPRRGGGRASVAAAAFALLFLGTAAYAEDATVSIDNFTFSPPALTIKAGTKVTFTNHDDIPHSVVDSGGKFKSKVLDTDDSYSMTFTSPGDITYFCGLHPHMKGAITVTP